MVTFHVLLNHFTAEFDSFYCLYPRCFRIILSLVLMFFMSEQGSWIGLVMGNSGHNLLLTLGFIIWIYPCTSSEGKTFKAIPKHFVNAFDLFTVLPSVVFSTIPT